MLFYNEAKLLRLISSSPFECGLFNVTIGWNGPIGRSIRQFDIKLENISASSSNFLLSILLVRPQIGVDVVEY